ncbi:MAG: permease prefix domain 1-containing protein, partial [Planctomycetota bacterium]
MISGRLAEFAGDEPAVAGQRRDDPVESWLGVFVRLLQVPEGDRQSIACEIEGHVRERVRDLLIDGLDEEKAVRQAIEELGETAELARRFQSANRFARRRLGMNFAVIAVGAGLVGLGVVALQPDDGTAVPAALFAPNSQEEVDLPGLDHRVEVRFDEAPLGEVVEFVAQELDRTVHVHWCELAEIDVDRHETTLTLAARQLSMRRLMDLVLESIDDPYGELAWSMDEELVELGTQSLFDERDIALVSYDVSGIGWDMERRFDIPYDEAVGEVTAVLQELVSPDTWESMGGRLAKIHVVGGKMFIQAPRRMHREVVWILGQLAS